MSSNNTHRLNSDNSRITYLFFDRDLLHVNSTTAQNNMVDTCTVLAAYSAAHPRYACCLCFPTSFRVAVIWLATEIIHMFCGGLRSRLVAHVQILWVDDFPHLGVLPETAREISHVVKQHSSSKL